MGIVAKYPNAKRIIWAQDEPSNMGAWQHVQRFLPNVPFELVARPASASPAGGLIHQHNNRLKRILDTIFAPESL
jgi:2-oxoglutarate dehydrogenase E1 component